MRPSDLKVGDRIRIIGMPGDGVPGYYLHSDTKRVFKMLIARGRSVRITRIDEYGSPWYAYVFRRRMDDGAAGTNSLCATAITIGCW